MGASCAVCGVGCAMGAEGAGPICPKCVAQLFARRGLSNEPVIEAEEMPSWFPLMRKREEAPRSSRERLADLRSLADRSRSSLLPPEEEEELVDATLSVRAAIRGVDLFPTSAPPQKAPLERAAAPSIAPQRPLRRAWIDRAALGAVVVCSLLVAMKLAEGRSERLSERMRFVATAISRDAALDAAKTASAQPVEKPKQGTKETEAPFASTKAIVPNAPPERGPMPKKAEPTAANRGEAPALAEPEAPKAPVEESPAKPAAPSLTEAMAAAVGKRAAPADPKSAPAEPNQP